ncbi:hypothetical protein [Flavihumibacter petaseus]|uniref:Uncharacterized protein n=1 Tax=Flavihumibacter petaseus NBRC 106054 TaxID=1220578 RepID=A0A0E9N5G5_9BACT|nr:hypothetical protein [Flavihumibacter petaseus]GAO44921.1 hypothetical protein FPE01S_04_01640 [Flavihumibacter petaseus NBRC 106054]
MKIRLVLFSLLLLAFSGSFGQTPGVVYTEPEKEDTRRTNFEILGKLGQEIFIYKNNRSDHTVGVYDNEMKLKKTVTLDFVPEKLISLDYITYPDRIVFFYQYQKKRVVYCDQVTIGAGAKIDSTPLTLDTTEVNYSSNNKIYTIVNSDDKQKIMLFKVNSSDPRRFVVSSFLYNSQVELLGRSRAEVQMDEKNEFFTDFQLSNAGELVVAKFQKAGSNSEAITGVNMLIKYPDSLNFSERKVNIGKQILDNIVLKVDNNNNKVFLASFFSRQKRGNMEGLYVVTWDKTMNEKILDTAILFTDEVRVLAKGNDANKKTAFNDFFIKSIYIRKNGGYAVVSEALYTTSRYNNFSRWDYMGYGNPWMSPMSYNYWSPYSSPWSMPWSRYGWNSPAQTRYFADNVLVLTFDKDNKLDWSNVITKSQFDDESDNLISYGNMNTGTEVHFLFNTFERRTFVLTDQSLDATGKLTRYPTYKNLDKGYDFMPRFAKQVSARQLIIPCLYRNYLCFAKVDF